MILDMGGVSETNLSLIKLIIAAFQQCQQASVAVKLVANPKQGEELKGFQETSQIAVSHSIEEAKAVL
jgi:anti-anti-sigma regulatory factor